MLSFVNGINLFANRTHLPQFPAFNRTE